MINFNLLCNPFNILNLISLSNKYYFLTLIFLSITIYLSIKSKIVVVKTINFISLLIVGISLPYFFLVKDNFAYNVYLKNGHIDAFNFKFDDAIFITFKISLFLITFSIISSILVNSGIIQRFLRYLSCSSNLENLFYRKICLKRFIEKLTLINFSNLLNKYSIVLIHLIFICFYTFTYLNKYAIVAVEPHSLPFKLSGIIYYLANYIIPSITTLIYFSYRRSTIYTIFLCLFSTIISLATLSKGAAMIILIPCILLNISEKKFYLSFYLSISVSSVFSLVQILRNNSYFSLNGVNQINTSLYLIIDTYNKFFFYGDLFIFKLLVSFKDILFRFDNFSNFILASNYDSSRTIGGKGFLYWLIYKPLVNLDVDAHHLAWQGYTMDKGLFHIGGLLSNFLIVYGTGIFNAFLFAFLCSSILCSSELICMNVCAKYNISKHASIIPICLTLLYFARGGMDKIFAFIFFTLLSISLILPKYFEKKRFSIVKSS